MQAALDAAKAVSPRIEVELIDLGGLSIAGWSPTPGRDDFNAILPKLNNPLIDQVFVKSSATPPPGPQHYT